MSPTFPKMTLIFVKRTLGLPPLVFPDFCETYNAWAEYVALTASSSAEAADMMPIIIGKADP